MYACSVFRPLVESDFDSFTNDEQRMICKAAFYGRLMQVKADSFLPNQRFNLAMGLAAIHVGQHFRKVWMTAKKSGEHISAALLHVHPNKNVVVKVFE